MLMRVTLSSDSQMPSVGEAPEISWQTPRSILSLDHPCQGPEQGSWLPRGHKDGERAARVLSTSSPFSILWEGVLAQGISGPPHFTFPAGRLLTSCFILSLNLPICKVGVLLLLPAVREKCEKMREGPNARQSYPLVVCDLLLSAFSQDVRDSQTSPGRDEGPGWQGGGSVDRDEQEDLPMC